MNNNGTNVDPLNGDLRSLVTDNTEFFDELHNSDNLLKLENAEKNFLLTTQEFLRQYYGVSDADIIANYNDIDSVIEYISENASLLKSSNYESLKRDIYDITTEKKKIEDDIRKNCEDIFYDQNTAINENKEILANYYNNLMKDKLESDTLSAKNDEIANDYPGIENQKSEDINKEIDIQNEEIDKITTEMDILSDKIKNPKKYETKDANGNITSIDIESCKNEKKSKKVDLDKAKTNLEYLKRKLIAHGNYTNNQDKIKALDVRKRIDDYNDKLNQCKKFSEDVKKSQKESLKKFKEYGIEAPNNKNGASNSQQADNSNNQTNGSHQANDSQQANNPKDKSGSTSLQECNSPELTSEEYAKNLANDILKHGVSSKELRKKLQGKGFGYFVAALPHLSNRNRKKILNMLKERRNELRIDTTRVNSILGCNVSDLNKDFSKYSIDDLNKLKRIMDDYDKTMESLVGRKDDIEYIQKNFFDVVALDSLMENYKKNRFQRFFENNFKSSEYRKRTELLGTFAKFKEKEGKQDIEAFKIGNDMRKLLGKDVIPTECSPKVEGQIPNVYDGKSSLEQMAKRDYGSRG